MRTISRVRTTRMLLLLGVAFFAFLVVIHPHTVAAPRPTAEVTPAPSDTIDLSKIYGKIQIVEHFPDYKVQVVDHFPDLKVQIVEHFPDAPGKWQIVEHFPDFKIQVVEHFPDFKIQYVEHFPGVNR